MKTSRILLFRGRWTNMFWRKIVTAIVSSFLLAFTFSWYDGFSFNLFWSLFYLNLMIVGTYGITASLISDWLSKLSFTSRVAQEIFSFLLHCAAGSVFQIVSLVSAISFFIVDRLLMKIKIKWWTAAAGLVIVTIVFFIVAF